MAIRDFGNSLLADVRERADEQRDEARRYAKKQDKSNLLKGLGAMAGGALIKSAGTAITASLENKTKDFLANSQMSDNVVLVNSADAKIKEAIAYREEKQHRLCFQILTRREEITKTNIEQHLHDTKTL